MASSSRSPHKSPRSPNRQPLWLVCTLIVVALAAIVLVYLALK